MQNRTEGRRPAEHTETAEGGDMFIAAKPGWMDEPTWAEIKAKAVGKLDELVGDAQGDAVRRAVDASPEGGCSERTWCVMGPDNSEHLQYHAGDVLDLAEAKHQDDGPSTGWWASPSEDRGKGPVVSIEGVIEQQDGKIEAYETELGVFDLWVVLKATATQDAYASLLKLVRQTAAEKRDEIRAES